MTAFTHNGVKHTHIRYFGLFILFCLMFSSLVAQEYAFMYIENGSTSVNVGTGWTTVGSFSSTISSTNWSLSGNTLTAADNDAVEGMYLIKYSLSFGADDAVWSTGIFVGSSLVPSEPFFQRTISDQKKGDMGNVSGSFLVQISKSQTITLKVKTDGATKSFTPVHAQVVAVKVKKASVNYYGGMHISSDESYSMTTTFAKLTGFVAFDELSDWTFSESVLTAGSLAGGTYLAVLSVSLTGDNNGVNKADCSFDVYKNGSTTNILAVRKTDDVDIGNISAAGLISIETGDAITVYGALSLGSTLVAKKATLSLYKLVDASDASYAGMKITGDQTVTIDTKNEWTTVGTYTEDVSGGWSFASDVFTPSSANTYGYSLIDYAVSLSTTNTVSYDDVEFGIFIGSHMHPEFTTIRRLSDENDVGAVSGNGIFFVAYPDSTITMKVRNTTSDYDLTIKKSYMAGAQIRYVTTDTPLPISLNSFNIEKQNNAVKLNWQTASEVENLGYKIYRKENEGMFEEISSYTYNDALRGQGTTTDMHDYEFIDTDVEVAKEYIYLLSDISYHMEEIKHIDYLRTIYLPEGIHVDVAYPNPFNPQCTIPYTIDVNENVRIDLLNISGKLIRTLVNKDHLPGNYRVNINEPALSSGIYLIRVQSGTQVEIQKIMMLK